MDKRELKALCQMGKGGYEPTDEGPNIIVELKERIKTLETQLKVADLKSEILQMRIDELEE